MKQYTLLTNSGINKLLKTASDGSKIALKEIVVSDYDGELSEQTASIPNEKYRGAINAITIDENDNNILDVDAIIPPEVGGFYIKTAGIFCDDGSLFAVARLADTYKPLLNEGSSKDITLNFKLQIANASESIILKVDNNIVLATRKWCEKMFLKIKDKIDAYTKQESDDKFAPKIELDNFWPREATLLPAGDYTKMGFWRKLKAGYYFFNVGSVNDQNPTNYPSSYGFVEHLVFDGEHYIVWRTTNTECYEIHFNHILDDNHHFVWIRKDLYGVGVGQTVQDVKSQRQAGEIYTNDTGKPIFISVVCESSSQGGTYEIWLEINGIAVQKVYGGAASGLTPMASICGVITAGATYKIITHNNIGSTIITGWTELR